MHSSGPDSATTLERLMQRHPLLFRHDKRLVRGWVPAGWEGIVDELCTRIENALGNDIKYCTVHEVGQAEGLLNLHYRFEPPEFKSGRLPVTHCSREGELLPPYHPDIEFLAFDAMQKADSTCEWCGAVGAQSVVGGEVANPLNPARNRAGWGIVHTACSACRGTALDPVEFDERAVQRKAGDQWRDADVTFAAINRRAQGRRSGRT